MIAKTYELKIEELREAEHGGSLISYYSRGHHDATDFLHALRAYDVKAPTHNPVYADWWRFIPRSMSGDGVYEVAEAHSKGAFPVTVIEAT